MIASSMGLKHPLLRSGVASSWARVHARHIPQSLLRIPWPARESAALGVAVTVAADAVVRDLDITVLPVDEFSACLQRRRWPLRSKLSNRSPALEAATLGSATSISAGPY